MIEQTFITKEKLDELRKEFESETFDHTNDDVLNLRIDVRDFIYTLDKMYLAIETTQSILNNLSEISRNKKEVEQEQWAKLGEDLRQLRMHHEISLHSLAGILDTDWAHIDNAERGLIDPTEYLREASVKL